MTASKISVLGTGYVGLTTGTCFSSLGHDVTCIDIDANKIASLTEGVVPIFEPGLDELVARARNQGLLRFTSDPSSALGNAEFVFLCLPTPTLEDGSTDLEHLLTAVRLNSSRFRSGAIIVNKSTVPVGTAELVEGLIGRTDIKVVSNPEFLREGQAVEDFLNPDRVIIGSEELASGQSVANLYRPLKTSIIHTDRRSAETIKYMANAYLATRLSFVNQIAGFCHSAGATLSQVIEGLTSDPRIGRSFFTPGPGWGGSCFPKDTYSLETTARQVGFNMSLVETARLSNRAHLEGIVSYIDDTITKQVPNEPRDKISLGFWGLAFKANTDDVRDSPAVKIAQSLVDLGYELRIYDSIAQEVRELKRYRHTSIGSTIEASDALIVATEWHEFLTFDPVTLRELMRGKTVIDLRYFLDGDKYTAVGLSLHQFGNTKIP